MTLVLILFFISLGSIAFMVGKRVTLMRAGHVTIHQDTPPLVPEAKEVHHAVIKNVKKYGFIITAIILRMSIRSSMFVKKQGLEIKNKAKDRLAKHYHKNPEQKKEVSGFLKSMSEYKSKVKALKKKIREEESKY